MVWSGSRGAWARLVASVDVLLAWRGNGRWRGFCGLVRAFERLLTDALEEKEM